MLSEFFNFSRSSFSSFIYKPDGSLRFMPFLYVLELTHKCNLACDFCYVGHKSGKNELSLEQWKKLIRQIPFYGFISLSGGEPFLKQNFFEILNYAQKQVFGKVNIFSNGVLVDDAIAKELIKRRVLLLNISIDGIGKHHDKFRKIDGTFDKVVSNIENLVSLRKSIFPLIDIQTVMLNENLDQIPQIYELICKLKCNFHSIALVNNNSLRQNSTFYENLCDIHCNKTYPLINLLDSKKFKEMYKELRCLQKKYRVPIRFEPSYERGFDFLNIERFFNSEKSIITDIYRPCKVLNSRVFVNPQGIVYPCLSINMGNIKENSNLFEILNSSKYCNFRRKIKEEKLINACQLCCDLVVKKY